jgi:hypothetical protein
MEPLSDEEHQILADCQKQVPLTRHILYYQLLLSLDMLVGVFEEQDRLILKRAKTSLLDKQERLRMAIIKTSAEKAKDADVEKFALIVVEMNSTMERELNELYITSMEDTLGKLSVAGIAKAEAQLRIPPLEQGSSSNVDWQKVAELNPGIVYKRYQPAFEALHGQVIIEKNDYRQG